MKPFIIHLPTDCDEFNLVEFKEKLEAIGQGLNTIIEMVGDMVDHQWDDFSSDEKIWLLARHYPYTDVNDDFDEVLKYAVMLREIIEECYFVFKNYLNHEQFDLNKYRLKLKRHNPYGLFLTLLPKETGDGKEKDLSSPSA